jgi:hypothetical protein
MSSSSEDSDTPQRPFWGRFCFGRHAMIVACLSAYGIAVGVRIGANEIFLSRAQLASCYRRPHAGGPFFRTRRAKAWMPATSAGMTGKKAALLHDAYGVAVGTAERLSLTAPL